MQVANDAVLTVRLLESTNAIARALLPPGLFDNPGPAPPSYPQTLDVAVQVGYVFLREDATGIASSGDCLAMFPEEMVWRHTVLHSIIASEQVTPLIAHWNGEVAFLERCFENVPEEAYVELCRRIGQATHQLDLAMQQVIEGDAELRDVIVFFYGRIATDDPAVALRIAGPA